MTLHYVLGAAAGGLLVLAAAEPSVATIAEYSAVALMGFLLWLQTAKIGPKERKAALAHTEVVVGKMCDRFDDVQERHHKDNMAIQQSIRDVTAHCAVAQEQAAKK